VAYPSRSLSAVGSLPWPPSAAAFAAHMTPFAAPPPLPPHHRQQTYGSLNSTNGQWDISMQATKGRNNAIWLAQVRSMCLL